jgi:uncharacterized damage-inducible protein DinB
MATELDVVREIYDYNLRKLIEYHRKIWNLPVKERYRDRRATFPNLVDIYLHILDDYRFWFIQAYSGRKFKDFPLGIRIGRAKAQRATREVDRLVRNVLRNLRPKDLDRRILHPADQKLIPVRSMLLQMIEGDLQHKGELNALFWQMDLEPPAIDLT